MLSPMLALSWGRTQTITAGSTARTPNPNRTPPTNACLDSAIGCAGYPLPPAEAAAQPLAWAVPHRMSPACWAGDTSEPSAQPDISCTNSPLLVGTMAAYGERMGTLTGTAACPGTPCSDAPPDPGTS